MGNAKRLSECLRVDRMPDGRRRLVRDLVIDLGEDLGVRMGGFVSAPPEGFGARTTHVTVPAGFDTDFSSIPGFARGMYRFDTVDLAGVCHDYAYSIGVSRKQADRMWEIVATSGERRVGRFRGWLGRIALRAGGWNAYRKHRRLNRVTS